MDFCFQTWPRPTYARWRFRRLSLFPDSMENVSSLMSSTRTEGIDIGSAAVSDQLMRAIFPLSDFRFEHASLGGASCKQN
jgi:hypothetical protein